MGYSLKGIELRYVLAMQLAVHGPATITELTEALDWHGFCVRGRPSKAISDALRWEIGRGRVRRLGQGRYGPGYMPRGTEHRIHQRVLALREAAAELSLKGGQLTDLPARRPEWLV
ncbi:hypothetical protein A5624_06525 [Mycobacterium sp. 1482292.6]|uniref:hypothetical protein n=1 Tax=Mycobacterium sp. 1482292.6 TaxID=1834081 RepID=UPI000800FBBC|nr:hypothetical protein [Mycobacterium sp. 1482292.6]OBJ01362.1 hypothetical protein A5624_06525 [Mycobacterium sp. 1482292.6]